MAQKISRNFSSIGKNIKKIRQAKNISQSEFASLFHLARPSVGAYEEGRSEPKIETLIAISSYFNLSIDTLLTRELTTSDIFNMGILNEKLDKAHGGKGKPNQTAPFIAITDRVDYILNHSSKVFINDLHTLGTPAKAERIFEHEGNEMTLEDKGITHGDYLFCSLLEKGEADALVVAVTNDRILTRRLTEVNDESLTLKPDNPAYDQIMLKASDVLELWKITGVYTRHMKHPTNLELRISAIEAELSKINRE